MNKVRRIFYVQNQTICYMLPDIGYISMVKGKL